MFRYNLKIALRNILKNKGFSFINIMGLTMGMACSLFMLLVVYEGYKIDTFHKNFDNIFLLQQNVVLESGTYTADRVGGAIGPAVKNNFPQIRQFVRIGKPSEMLLAYFTETGQYTKPVSFVEKEGLAVDSTFFEIFSFEMIKGNPQKALVDNNFIVLTESLSEKIFGEEDPLGKTIKLNDGLDLTVTGIIKDVEENSSLQFTYIIPFNVMEMIGTPIDSYGGTNFMTYFLLNNPEDRLSINASLNPFIDNLHDEQIETDRFLTHIRKAFLYGESQNYLGIYIFAIIGIGVLLIACINYINLTTAQSSERAKEVGIRKTGGAERYQLIGQFLGENILVAIIAVHLAILMIELALPYINSFSQNPLDIELTDPNFWFIILGMVLATGLLSGIYPAFFLSSLKPVQVMKDFTPSGNKGNKLRKILVVVQFSLTLFFILSTLFLYRQFAYVKNADMGISKENVLYIPSRGEIWNKFDEIKSELKLEPGILNITTASSLPTDVQIGDINWGKVDVENNMIARILLCDENFLETMDLALSAGTFFTENSRVNNEEGVIVNEEIIKILGYQDDPIGQPFRVWDMDKKIIGVVKDFKFVPFDIGGKAIIIMHRPVEKFVFIKTSDGFNSEQMARVQNVFDKINPNYPFEYFYLEDFEYPFLQATDQLVTMLFYLCLLGIFISCMGLFGLALYTTQKRTKEIGIRKAFGASTKVIVGLLSKEFIKLILIACIIAIPISIMVMKLILSVFTVKIPINGIFITLVTLSMFAVSFITVAWQSLLAAKKDPVTSLKYE